MSLPQSVEGPKTNSIGPSEYNPVSVSSSPGVKVLWSGYDTLYLSYRLDLRRFCDMHETLGAWKDSAKASVDGVFRVPGEYDVFMSAKGRPNYQYILIRPGVGEIAVTLNPLFPPLRVRCYSEFIMACDGDLQVVAHLMRAFVEDIFGFESVTKEQISEIHVAADYVGWSPRVSEFTARRFLCNAGWSLEAADLETDIIHSLRWAGSGRPFSAALYNKTKEISEQSPDKAYMLDVYRAAGWSPDRGDVYRLEFRINRDGLRELEVETRDDLDPAAIIRYFMGMGSGETGAWLSFRSAPPGRDTNNRRWPVSPVWLAIRDGAIERFGQTSGLIYKRKRRANPVVDRLVTMAGGCLASVAAIVGEDRSAEIFAWAQKRYLKHLEGKGELFLDRVEVKRDKYLILQRERQAEQESKILAALCLRGMEGALRV